MTLCVVRPGFSPPALAPGDGWLLVCPSRTAGGDLRLVVVGEADLATCALLRQGLVNAASDGTGAPVIVDLSGLDFCDLLGLDALYAGLDAADTAGRSVTLDGISPRLLWLMATFPRPASISLAGAAGVRA